MSRLPLARVALAPGLASCVVAALLLVARPVPVAAGQDDALRNRVVQLGQVTGDDAFKAQVADVLQDIDLAKKLVPVAVEMAQAKDSNLTYYGALTLAQVAERQKDYKAVETLYRVGMDKAVKLYSTRKILQSYGGLVDALYKGKKYGDAARICREVLEIKTGDDTPRKFIVPVEDKFGESGFQEVPNFDIARPIQGAFYQMMIQATAKDGKYDQALKLADGLVRKNEGNWEDRELKGWVLREAGRYNEAAKVYEDVIERIGKDPDLTQEDKDRYTEINRYALSNILVEMKQIDKASEHMKWLLDRHPDEPGYYNDLGYIWADHGINLEEAEKLIRKALELDKKKRSAKPGFNAAKDRDRGAYLDSLGWVLFKQKKYEEAKKYLVEALKDPDAQHIEIFDHLGDTYLILGQREAALDAWRRGLEVAGDDRREKERKAEVEKKIQDNSK